MLDTKKVSIPLEIRRLSRHNLSLTGFTIIEFIFVIVILSVLVVMATVKMVDMQPMRIDMAARKIQTDIRYAQSLAVSTQKRTMVYFDVLADYYLIRMENQPNLWLLVTDPLSKGPLELSLNSGEFDGVQIEEVNFNGLSTTTGILVFDKWGNPYSYSFSTGIAVPLQNPAYIKLTGSKYVRILRGTGKVYIE